ncbi:MAG: MFS transporter [Oscillospiraceae bacterium]
MEEKFLNRNYILAVLSSTAVYMASSMLITVLPKYVSQGRAGGVNVGALMLSFTLFSGLTRIVWGRLSDKIGRIYVIYMGLLLAAMASAILLFKDSMAFLLLSRMVFGAGFSAVITAGATLSTEVVCHKDTSKAIAIYGLGGVLTQGIAPPLALFLYKYGIKSVVYVALALLAVSFIMSKSIKCVFTRGKLPQNKIFILAAVPESAVAGIITFATASVFSFVPLLTTQVGIGNVSGFFIANSIGLLFSRLIFAKISAAIPRNKLFFYGLALFVLGFVGISVAKSSVMLTVAGLFYGYGLGSIHPILNTGAVNRADKSDRAGAMAMFYIFQDFGVAFGSIVCGVLAESFQLKTIFMVCAAVAAFSAVPFIIISKYSIKNK